MLVRVFVAVRRAVRMRVLVRVDVNVRVLMHFGRGQRRGARSACG